LEGIMLAGVIAGDRVPVAVHRDHVTGMHRGCRRAEVSTDPRLIIEVRPYTGRG
jgi:hypothetical protein